MKTDFHFARGVRQSIALTTLALAVTACGGGGGNGSSQAKPTIPSTGTNIQTNTPPANGGPGAGLNVPSSGTGGTSSGSDASTGASGSGSTTGPAPVNPMLPPDPGAATPAPAPAPTAPAPTTPAPAPPPTTPSGPETPTTPVAPPAPTAAALILPLELLSDGSKPFTTQAVLNLNSPDVGNAAYLTFTCHRCAFFGAPEWEKTSRTPTRVKASVRILGGIDPASDDSVQWVDMTDATMEMPPAERLQGGLGVSGMYTARLKLKLDANTKARLTGAVGGNRVQFRFNGTDGESNGYRIIALNFSDTAGKSLATNVVKQVDIKAEKSRSYSSSDIASGRTLWHGTGILSKSTIVSRKLNASCQSCHADAGRDLQYFNYSDNSIVQRSRFHGLTEAQGKQIVAYVRSNPEGAIHVAHAAPWNPPYQPGPGLDSRDIKEWSAGAGLAAVTDTPIRALNALFGKPLDGPQATVTAQDLDNLFDAKNVQNTRETATSLQMPDWNAWLPAIGPEDVWPDDLAEAQPQYFHGSFNLGATASGDGDTWPNKRRTPKQQMEAMDAWLTANKGPTWGDWSHLTDRQRYDVFWKMQNLGWESWRFGGGGRSFKIAGNGKKNGVEVGADNLRRTADPTTMALNPAGNSPNSFIERSVLSLAAWQSVRQWNLVQKHGLEGNQRWFIGDVDSTAQKFNGIGEVRGWALQTPGVFNIAPHMAYQNTPDANGKDSQPVLQWEDPVNNAGSFYRSNIWYDLAMVLNPGAARQTTNYPVDWDYHMLFSAYATSKVLDQNKDGKNSDADLLALTHLLREIQVKAKYGQQNNNVIPVSSGGRAVVLATFNPTWTMRNYYNQPARWEALDDLQPGLYKMLVNAGFKQFNTLVGPDSGIPVSEWRRCDPNFLESNKLLQPYFGTRKCADQRKAIARTDDKGNPYLQTHGFSTSAESLAYAIVKGKELGVDSARLRAFETWTDALIPGKPTAADMQATMTVSPLQARVGDEVTATAVCTNAGNGKYTQADSGAVNAVCRIVGLPEGTTASCSQSIPVANLAAGSSITCTARFRPASAGTIALSALANSWSFDWVPSMGINIPGNGIANQSVRVQ